MKILALELSTSRGSLAWLDGEIEFTREWPNDRKNSAVFFENLQAVRRKFGAPATPILSSELLPQFHRPVIWFPSALILARLAKERRRRFCLPPLEPIYLREPHITIPNERNLPLLG